MAQVHTQLTLRIRSRAKLTVKGDTEEYTRYTSLKCLICRTLVYRVFQVVSPDVDLTEGPVAPSEDWAESELLKSLSGWIEVYKDCIVSRFLLGCTFRRDWGFERATSRSVR